MVMNMVHCNTEVVLCSNNKN